MGCRCSKRLARYVSTPKPASKGVVGKVNAKQRAEAARSESHTVEKDNIDERDVEVELQSQDIEQGKDLCGPQVQKKQEHAKRRAEEAEAIGLYDTAEAEMFYLMDLNWLSEWRSFAFKDGPLPGAIDNSRLVDPQTGIPKSGLQLKDDYRGVNESLWNFWYERYGGGPMVARKCLDLYSPPPSAQLEEGQPSGPTPCGPKTGAQIAETAQSLSKADEIPVPEGSDALKIFPLRLAFACPVPAVMVSKGLAALFEASPASKDEPLNTSEFPYGTVFVNIYDLGGDDLGKRINRVSTMNNAIMVGGVFHAGIEIYGFEWSFASVEGQRTGVWRTLPRMEMGHSYRGTMPLGTTKLSNAEVWQLLHRLAHLWPGEGYDLLRRNCLSFCNAFCDELGVRRIPGWVDRAPRAASVIMDTTAILGSAAEGCLGARQKE